MLRENTSPKETKCALGCDQRWALQLYCELASLARTVSNQSHCPNHNPWEEQEAANPDAGVISMQIHTLDDLEYGLERAAKETSKLVLFECCIRPDNINPALRRLGVRFSGERAGPGPRIR